MRRHALVALVLLAPFFADPIACSRSVPDLEHARGHLHEVSIELAAAAVHEDHAKVVDYMLPSIVASAGGRDRMLAIARKTAEDLKKEGWTIKDQSVRDDIRVAAGRDGIYGVAPYHMTMVKDGDPPLELDSFLVGFSSDDGETWRVVDGGALQQNPNALSKLFPKFPAELELPRK